MKAEMIEEVKTAKEQKDKLSLKLWRERAIFGNLVHVLYTCADDVDLGDLKIAIGEQWKRLENAMIDYAESHGNVI